ncbi:EF-hand domain-containing protein 1-like Protein [Tribolium castaneum]|uniref:EF-hand domain-containing protein 1-like Protein n=1 Tax=Tribolium castaneum TaxID=7070 RepID=D6WNG5_TRICA|nr:EF-hand domain-containing protein 1-like Protein [Tribolium castaneum]
MAGLPKLPGLTFTDPTLTSYHLSQTFSISNGYKIPKNDYVGIGNRELDSNSVKFISTNDPVRFDPSLTYGRTKAIPVQMFKPHYALYDQKCLTFKAFFKQGVAESPDEYYRVRHVNIIYFLEDDTITIMEPRTPNSGIDQGRLLKRHRIPKSEDGEFWHWKDFGVGRNIVFYGVVYHLVDCDTFTREYMASQGLVMAEPEQLPPDPYTQNRLMKSHQNNFTKTPSADDKFRRFLEYDGKILKFKAIWDDRDSEYGEIRKYEVLYFLADDTVAVKEIHTKNDGRDPYSQLLRKTKLPKIWTDRPAHFPSIYLETTDEEVTEFYQPKDLRVGETIFVLGRKMLLYDCDDFTRNYFKKALCMEQGPPMDISEKPKPPPEKKIPPHDGIGSLEDSLQNTLTFMPKPPRKDVVKQILNANKYLRYEMKMDDIHPEDSIRRFLLLYSLGDNTCKIFEPPIENSGIIGGKYLRSTLLPKPNTNPLDPEYYSPIDFYIGATITVFQQRFIITGADLYVYRYMQANSSKFPCEVIENIRNYMFNKGYLKDDIEKQVEENKIDIEKAERDAIGKNLIYTQTEMEKCLERFNIKDEREDPTFQKEYVKEPLVIPEHNVPSFGIQPVNNECPYPITTPPIPSLDCKSEAQRIASTEYDTEEEKIKKYYDKVLREHKHICENAEPQQPPPEDDCLAKERKGKSVKFDDNVKCE